MEVTDKREAWNKGKLVGQKPPLKPKDIWAIRIHLVGRRYSRRRRYPAKSGMQIRSTALQEKPP